MWAAKFIRVKVMLDVLKPLIPGFYHTRVEKSPFWVQFKYERLSEFCFNCGCLGHSINFCSKEIQPRTSPASFSLALKADSVEYRIFTSPEELL